MYFGLMTLLWPTITVRLSGATTDVQVGHGISREVLTELQFPEFFERSQYGRTVWYRQELLK